MTGCEECTIDNGNIGTFKCTKAKEKHYLKDGAPTVCNCGGTVEDAGDCNTTATEIEC